MQAAGASIVGDHRDAALGTVPQGVVYLEVIICGAVVLPFSNPIFQHLAHLSSRYWHFLDRIDFKGRCMEHLFDSPRGRFENSQGDHLVETDLDLLLLKLLSHLPFLRKSIHVIGIIGAEARGLAQHVLL